MRKFMETCIVEGNISVKAALLGKKRKVHKILVDAKKKDKDTAFILHKAKEAQVDIAYVKREEIDALATGKTHGGIIAYCGQRKYQNLEELVNKKQVFLALVEGVEDPFNFGYVLRTLYAAGCDGVLVPLRNWTTAADVVTRASAGASEYMNIIIADDMENTLTYLHQNDITLLCAQRKDAISLYSYTFPERICLAIGGEMRGLSKAVMTHSDQNLYIPYRSDFRNAMTAAASTAIFAFEVVRQKEN